MPAAGYRRATDRDARRIAVVVDDVMVNRILLSKMIGALGFEVVEVTNGREAVDVCRETMPDIVFMDIMMPHVDGLMATREIKALPGRASVPVVFVTAVSDEGLLHRCIEAGGDDFLVRPFSRTLLAAKVEAALRGGEIHRRMTEGLEALEHYQQRDRRELEVARRMVERVMTEGRLEAWNVRRAQRTIEAISGDVLLAARRPTGEQCFLVGDLACHGLPAAIGALTVQGIFATMVAKGFGLADLVDELNRKLCALLPVDRFLAAAFIEVDHVAARARIWNGGMPEVLVRGAAGGVIARFASENAPLGILAQDCHATVRDLSLTAGEQVFACTDGLLAACGPDGDAFGTKRLEQAIAAPGDARARFDALLDALDRHCLEGPRRDDLSLLMVEHDPRA